MVNHYSSHFFREPFCIRSLSRLTVSWKQTYTTEKDKLLHTANPTDSRRGEVRKHGLVVNLEDAKRVDCVM